MIEYSERVSYTKNQLFRRVTVRRKGMKKECGCKRSLFTGVSE